LFEKIKLHINKYGFDKLAITGCLLGIFSLFLPWLSIKPNRLSAGIGLQLIEFSVFAFIIVFSVLWIFCLFLSLYKKDRFNSFALAVVINIIFILTFLSISRESASLLQNSAPSVRVSLSVGFWVTLLACYIVIFSASKRLSGHKIFKNLFLWLGPAFFIFLLLRGDFNSLSIMVEFSGQRMRFMQEFLNHIFLVAVSVFIGSILGILLGIWASRNKIIERPVFFVTNIAQTIPSLALFGLLIAPLSALSFRFPALREIGIRGIGNAPAIIALVIYSLLPIVRNTFISIRQISPAVIDAGKGMGMSRFQVFSRIEIPLSIPLVLEGIRIASVQSVGLAAVAALIGAGGLGWFIFQGLGQAAPDMILLGTLPIILLALFTDGLMRFIIKISRKKTFSGGPD
jgi:osmoprotectant transport system permease protein